MYIVYTSMYRPYYRAEGYHFCTASLCWPLNLLGKLVCAWTDLVCIMYMHVFTLHVQCHIMYTQFIYKVILCIYMYILCTWVLHIICIYHYCICNFVLACIAFVICLYYLIIQDLADRVQTGHISQEWSGQVGSFPAAFSLFGVQTSIYTVNHPW